MPNVETILREHVTLNVDCIDRLYLNGYVPRLQRPENLWWFLHEHRGNPVVSPVLLKHMVDSFVASIREFAERQAIPIVHFERGQRKEEIARRYGTLQGEGRSGVERSGAGDGRFVPRLPEGPETPPAHAARRARALLFLLSRAARRQSV